MTEHPPTTNAPDGWRPIETAPKDGTIIIIGRPEKKLPRKRVIMGASAEAYWDGDGWASGCTEPDCLAYGHFFNPTHWMPFPPPPKAGA